MKGLLFALFVGFVFVHESVANPPNRYSKLRKEILDYEMQLTFGARLQLDNAEEAANAVLMNAKKSELSAAFENPGIFNPGKNFLTAKKDIEKSEVFKMIRRMPKGAVLHAHDAAIVSFDYMYNNITFRENLYVCNGEQVRLQFFKEPDNTCNWELLSDVRQDLTRAEDVNNKIKQHLTMATNTPDSVYTDVNKAWDKFMSIFIFMGPIITYKPIYEAHFYRGLEELYEDNVMYIELRTTLPTLYDLDGNTYSKKQVVELYQAVTERFKKDHPDFLGVKLIYAPVRSADLETAKEYIKTMRELNSEFPEFVVGFDLVGQEDKGHTLKYFADLLVDVDANINFFMHAGETNWYGESTDENLVDALLLNTRRIGHGYALTFHPFLLQLVKKLNIAIEVNPISNQVLSLVGDLRNHAARRLFAEDYPIVISNDDPGLWGARALSYDFYEAFMALMSDHSDLRALKQLALNSLTYSAMSNAEKKHAMMVWERKWNEFVKTLKDNEF